MSNLPLQPLVWDVHEVAAIINMTAESPLHSYTIYPDQYEGGYVIYYFERMTNESGREYFNSSDEAQEWAQSTHYPSKMQLYVKPMPTWIDASERLPEEDGLYLVLRKGFTFEIGNESDLVPKVSGWNGGRGCFDDDFDNVLFTHWMPLPELPISKESDYE